MIQFKDLIFREVINQNPKLMEAFSQSTSSRLAKQFVVIPAQCPKSAIVFGDRNRNYKSMAKKLYFKYVKEDAPYETIVDWTIRHKLENIIEDDQWESSENNEDPLTL